VKLDRRAAALALLAVGGLVAAGIWLATPPPEPEMTDCDHCNSVHVPGTLPEG